MNIWNSLICILVALGVIAAATYLPLSTQHERIVALQDVSESIVVTADQHIRQVFHHAAGTYSGIILFSDEQELADRQLFIRIEDIDGRPIAQSYAVRSSYISSGNILQLEALMPRFDIQDSEEYTLDVSLARGDQMTLKTVRHEATNRQLLSFSLIQPVITSFGLRQGLSIGTAFLLVVFLISYIKHERKKLQAAVCCLILFAPLATLGYIFSDNALGIADWDYYFTLHDSYRKAIVEHHTFPFWNPYICGGTAGLADPEFPVFSLTFLLELIFGIPVGLRMAIVLSVAVGGIGMLMLAKRLGRSMEAGLVAAIAVAFGTVNLLEITEGHVNVLTAMWIPWIFWAWHTMVFGKKKPIVCGIFLALTFLGGGIYLLMYTGIAFIGLVLLVQHRRVALIRTVQAILWALGFSAFKLIPVLVWLKQFPDDAYASSAYTLPWITEVLFGRHIHGADIIVNQMTGWHEYGAYIGYIIFGLSLIGLSYFKISRTVRVLAVAVVVALGISTLGPHLRPIFDQLWFFPRSSISRFILFAIIPIALLASYGLDRIAGWLPNQRAYIKALLVGFVAIDIFGLTYQLSQQAFVLPHVVPTISPAPHPIVYTSERFDLDGNGSRHTRSYDAYKAGYGVLAYCSVLGPQPAVRTITDENHEIITVRDPGAHTELLSWDYNTVRVISDAPESTHIILNTNYAQGWTANGQPAIVVDNRVAAQIPAGVHDVVFSYKAPGFRVGLLITALTLLIVFSARIRYI